MSYPRKVTPNKFAGKCIHCGIEVPAMQGILTRTFDNRAFAVKHHPRRTVYPTGPWDKFEAYETGGCPTWEKGTAQ